MLIRKVKTNDYNFIREMMYEAIFTPEGDKRPPFDVIDLPELAMYTHGWMKETDLGFVAEINGLNVGAIWARRYAFHDKGYGFISEYTPELSMAIKAQHRRKGIGEALLEFLLIELKKHGYANVSLSVDKRNRGALCLYKKKGFIVERENNTDLIMVKYFEYL